MATISKNIEKIDLDGNRSWLVTWNTLTTTDTVGATVTLPAHSDRSVQISGTFGGTTVTIEGSNDGTNFQTLDDFQGNELSFASADLENIAQAVYYLRPLLTGGDGTTDIDVSLLLTGAL
jgi:hypothetical protein